MSTKVHLHKRLLSAAAADETKSEVLGPARVGQVYQLTFYCEFGTGVTAGEVIIETAASEDFAGTWDAIKTFTYSAGAPIVDTQTVDGPFAFVRARINTAIANGTVNVDVIGA